MKKKNKKLKKKVAQTTNSVSDEQETQSASSQQEVATKIEENPQKILDEKYAYVHKDVKKVLSYIGLILILLVGFYFLDTKTSVLNSFGNWIYKVTNIQAG